MTDTASPPNNSVWRNVAVLVGAQAVLGAQLPMLFVVGGLVGQSLAPTPLLATLPISLIMFGSMTTAPWLSPVMQRHGRRVGFFIGAAGGALGGIICSLGLWWDSFPLFLIGSYFTGVYMSAQGFYRFAAADSAEGPLKAKAISYVLAGGLLGAVIGPELVKRTAEAMILPFLGTYLTAIGLNLAGAFLFFGLDNTSKTDTNAAEVLQGRSRGELLRDPKIAVAMICAMVSYALMTLVMTSTPLAVVGCGFTTGDAADVVRAHVLAMYAPAFFTGHLIARFGAERVVWTGLACLMIAAGVALSGVALNNFFLALVLLGVGWNFGFIGATAMLAQSHHPSERGAVEGMNDGLVFGMVTIASLASGALMNSGAETVEGWNAVNYAMAPFLTLAGGAIIWLKLQPKPVG